MFQKSVFSQVLVKLSFEELNCSFKKYLLRANASGLIHIAFQLMHMVLRTKRILSPTGNKGLISLR